MFHFPLKLSIMVLCHSVNFIARKHLFGSLLFFCFYHIVPLTTYSWPYRYTWGYSKHPWHCLYHLQLPVSPTLLSPQLTGFFLLSLMIVLVTFCCCEEVPKQGQLKQERLVSFLIQRARFRQGREGKVWQQGEEAECKYRKWGEVIHTQWHTFSSNSVLPKGSITYTNCTTNWETNAQIHEPLGVHFSLKPPQWSRSHYFHEAFNNYSHLTHLFPVQQPWTGF